MRQDKRCEAKTRRGEQCPNKPSASGFCFAHDPARAQERTAARRKGGQHSRIGHSTANAPQKVRDVQSIFGLLDYILGETIMLENGVARSRVLVALAAAYTEAVRGDELETRISALESEMRGTPHGA